MEREILISHEEIVDICKDIGNHLNEDLANEEKIPVLVGVLKGSLPFMQELVKNINVLCFTDYIQISSYSSTC